MFCAITYVLKVSEFKNNNEYHMNIVNTSSSIFFDPCTGVINLRNENNDNKVNNLKNIYYSFLLSRIDDPYYFSGVNIPRFRIEIIGFYNTFLLNF